MTLATRNGNLILVGSNLSQGCLCCCASQTKTYGYFDSIPPAPPFCDCPCSGDCVTGNITNSNCQSVPCTPGPGPASCCGAVLNAYVRSRDFSDKCKKPKATVFVNSGLDDYGVIEGDGDSITVTGSCGSLGRVAATTTLTPYVVDNGDGTIYLKLNVTVTNAAKICGPYGVASLTVRWFFE